MTKAFNRGCDARVNGVPYETFAYADDYMRRMWQLGWLEVERHYGEEAKWPVAVLPRIGSAE